MPEVVLCSAECVETLPTVVIEVSTPTLRFGEWQDRRAEYAAAGVEEWYLLYPARPTDIEGWRREGDKLVPIRDMAAWVSPRLRVRFAVEARDLVAIGADGQRYRVPDEVTDLQERAEKLAARLRELGIDPDAV